MSNMILPVDSNMALVLKSAEDKLVELAGAKVISDHNDYVGTVEVLNDLVKSILAAMNSSFLTVRGTIGARFDCGVGTDLARALDESIGYLRNTAVPKMNLGLSKLSRSYSDNTSAARFLLAELYERVTSSIQTMAKNDLAAAVALGPVQLIAAAEAVYGIAHPKKSD